LNDALKRDRNAPRLLIHSDRAGIFTEKIKARFPALPITISDTYAGLADKIDHTKPEIVLSHKFEDAVYPGRVVVEADSVRWIHCGGTGVDHFAPWDASRLTITNSPGVASKVMSEYALAAVYALNLYLPRYLRRQIRHEWKRGTVRTSEGGTMVVIGLGRIGRAVCARAKAAGMRVIGVRSKPEAIPEADRTLTSDRLFEALRLADYVVITVPRTKETDHLIDADALAQMKSSAFLINLSRGGIVDESALIKALQSGQLGGAAIDVFDQEPLPPNSPFWDLENVIVTPHSAGFVEGWEPMVTDLFCDNLDYWLRGAPLQNVVVPERGY